MSNGFLRDCAGRSLYIMPGTRTQGPTEQVRTARTITKGNHLFTRFLKYNHCMGVNICTEMFIDTEFDASDQDSNEYPISQQNNPHKLPTKSPTKGFVGEKPIDLDSAVNSDSDVEIIELPKNTVRDIFKINPIFLTPAEKREKAKILADGERLEREQIRLEREAKKELHRENKDKVSLHPLFDSSGKVKHMQEERSLQSHEMLQVALPSLPEQHGTVTQTEMEHVELLFQLKSYEPTLIQDLPFTLVHDETETPVKPERRRTQTSIEDVKTRLAQQFSPEALKHPACIDLLSKLDIQRDVHSMWTEKYKPTKSSQVLCQDKNQQQVGRHVSEWLQWYKLSQSVQPKKKTKKRRFSDDFVTESDEDKPTIYKPILLLIGDTGCGKSSLVHAATVENGYQVMEMNFGHKRSGKDVIAHVGDAVVNYGVSGKHAAAAQPPKKGKKKAKGVMDSFVKKRVASSDEEMPVLSPGKMTQTVILFEEVDVLLESEKSFFPTVSSLAEKSKRPIVMTSNDDGVLDYMPEELRNQVHPLYIQRPNKSTLGAYLSLVGVAEGVWIEEIVDRLVRACGCDVRWSLMMLEWLCKGPRSDGLRVIDETALMCVLGMNHRPSSLRHHFGNDAFEMTNLGFGTTTGVYAVANGDLLSHVEAMAHWSEVMSLSQTMEMDQITRFMVLDPDVYRCDVEDVLIGVPVLLKPDYLLMYENGLKYYSNLDYIITALHEMAHQYLVREMPFGLERQKWYIECLAKLGYGTMEPLAWEMAGETYRRTSLDILDGHVDFLDGQPTAIVVDYLPYIRAIIKYESATRDTKKEMENLNTRKSRKRLLPKRYLGFKFPHLLELVNRPSIKAD